MQALSEPKVSTEQPAAVATAGADQAKKQALRYMFGAQRLMVDEFMFAVEAIADRMRTETHLFGEFAAKLASAHSVRDWNAMGRECSQHQLDFVRRDCDRLLKHSQRLIDATSKLLDNRS
jgi:hypothetical protein